MGHGPKIWGRRTPALISHTRWVSYASASAASIFISSYSCEANIIHVSVNRHFSDPDPGPSNQDSADFPLGTNAAFNIAQIKSGGYGGAFLNKPYPGRMAGHFDPSVYPVGYFVSKLPFGVPISQQHLVSNYGLGVLANSGLPTSIVPSGLPIGEWLAPGEGFIGFSFDAGAGAQYGWARIIMDGQSHLNTFTLVDYAYGSPGERVTTGQVSTPDSGGSLGLLAIGASALIAWRGIRAKHTAADNEALTCRKTLGVT